MSRTGNPRPIPDSVPPVPVDHGVETVGNRITIDVQLDGSSPDSELHELHRGLVETPRRIPSKYFYDRRGSGLFERITQLPEYYLTRTEQSLLAQLADHICAITGAEELVELGSGAATKTRILLDAMARSGRLRRYVPFDVSESEVRRVALELTAEYSGLTVHGMVADFTHHLRAIPQGEHRLVILLGSTIRNYGPQEATDLLTRIGLLISTGDFFLLGADLVKDVERLEAAYNDSAGVTAEFNRNILRVVNRVADADFVPEAFKHLAFYNRQYHWIELRLVSSRAQKVHLRGLDLEIHLGEGEEILTEISSKYERQTILDMLGQSGFELAEWHADSDQLFALALARKTS